MAKLAGATVGVVFVDANTITFTTPSLPTGAQRLTLINPDGESISLDAAFTAN